MHPQHSIDQSLAKYGIKNCTQACFAIYVDFPPQQLEVVTNELNKCTFSMADLNQHVQYIDV